MMNGLGACRRKPSCCNSQEHDNENTRFEDDKKRSGSSNRCYSLLTEEGPEHNGAEFQHFKRLAKVLTRIVFRNVRSGQRRNKLEMQRKHQR